MSKAKVLFAALAATSLSSAAFAADLPSRRVAPAPVAVAPFFTWTGFYVGVNLGYGWGHNAMTGHQIGATNITGGPLELAGGAWKNPANIGSFLGGGQIGYNYQITPTIVLGLEADFQWLKMRSNSASFPGYFSPFWGVNSIGIVAGQQSIDWYGTLRGRLGITPFAPNFMMYVTGGLAYGKTRSTYSYLRSDNVPPAWMSLGGATASDTKLGWTAGVGVEWAPLSMPNLSLKAEYLYTDLGSTTLTSVGPSITPGVSVFNISVNKHRHEWHTLRAGLNYRFGGWASAPVVAKY